MELKVSIVVAFSLKYETKFNAIVIVVVINVIVIIIGVNMIGLIIVVIIINLFVKR